MYEYMSNQSFRTEGPNGDPNYQDVISHPLFQVYSSDFIKDRESIKCN